jgi:2-amino-4-hydroxy-6-hydroxymethyldihydropteridine diphosphokinase
MSVAFIAVGANLEPEKNIRAALLLLRQATKVTGSSTFYRTMPMGGGDQPPYFNGVWQIETNLSPADVKARLLLSVEQQLGRARTRDKFAPRTIDLDLVLYDDLVLDGSDIKLPHPDLTRPFVYFPVVELLGEMPRGAPAGLPAKIRRLLPQRVPAATPGEPLPELTRELKDLIRSVSCPRS